MKRALFGNRALALGAVLAGFAVAPSGAAATSTPVDSSGCSNPLLSQPFTAAGDTNWYMLVPGQTPGHFDGTGWTLSGGAKAVTTQLANGTSSSVLDLPSGSRAVSPTVCLTSSYPTARMMVRNAVGADGVSFYVSYQGTSTWTTPKNTGQVHGTGTSWTLSSRVNVQPNNASGWQPARFTLIPGGTTSRFQVYDFYVDPRMVG